MNTEKLKFQKVRTISEVLEDAFSFLQAHFIKMLKVIWEVNKVYIILFVIFSFAFYYRYSIFLDEMITKNNMTNAGMEVILGLLLTLYTLIVTARVYATGYGYIRNYIENDGQINLAKIKAFTDDKWWGYILLSILVGILVIIGFLLFIIPGIWVLVPLSVAFPIYFLEDEGVMDSVKKSFQYVSGKWWYSFGVLFFTFLIIMVLNTIVSFPATIYSMMMVISAAKQEGVAQLSTKGDLVFSFLTVISNLGKLLISIVQIPVMVFLYYSLKEYHTAQGMLDKIEEIGE